MDCKRHIADSINDYLKELRERREDDGGVGVERVRCVAERAAVLRDRREDDVPVGINLSRGGTPILGLEDVVDGIVVVVPVVQIVNSVVVVIFCIGLL